MGNTYGKSKKRPANNSVGKETKTSRKNANTGSSSASRGRGTRYSKGSVSDIIAGQSRSAITASNLITQGQKASISNAGYNVNYHAGFNNGIDTFNHMKNYGNTKVGQNVFYDECLTQTSGMAIHYIPSFGGNNNEANSPINQSAIKLKMYLDTQLGVKRDYSAADLAVYLCAITSVIHQVEELRRDISIWNMEYDWPNFTPDGLYSLLGYTYEGDPYLDSSTTIADRKVHPSRVTQDIAKRTNMYVDQINQLIDVLNRLPMPADFPLFNVNNDILNNIYTDGADVSNAQKYVFVSDGYYEFDEFGAELGSQLRYRRWFHNAGRSGAYLMTIQDRIDILESCIQKISWNTTDMRQAIQDMYNAMGTSAMYRVPYIVKDSMPPVVFDEDMLTSIENAALMQGVVVENILSHADKEVCVGRPKSETSVLANAINTVNIPLQFHCAPDAVSLHNIECALRFHPICRYRDDDIHYSENGTMEEVDMWNFGWMYGFAIPISISYCLYRHSCHGVDGESSPWGIFHFTNRLIAGYADTMYMTYGHDFKVVPPAIFGSPENTADGGQRFLVTRYYVNSRDTEVTLDLEYLAYWFRAMAETAWNTTKIWETNGQRTLNG